MPRSRWRRRFFQHFNYRIFGNNVNHAATNNPSGSVTTLYHGVYLSEFHHNVDFGWNTIAFVMGGQCFQQHVNVGPGDYDLHIHDNVIHDCPEDAIVSTTTNQISARSKFITTLSTTLDKGRIQSMVAALGTASTCKGGATRSQRRVR